MLTTLRPEIGIGGTMMNWRRKSHGDGVVAVDYGLAPNAALEWQPHIEGWGGIRVFTLDLLGNCPRLDDADFPRLDVLMMDAGWKTVDALKGAQQTIARTKPYMVVAFTAEQDEPFRLALADLGYPQWASIPGFLILLPPGDPNWSKVNKARHLDKTPK